MNDTDLRVPGPEDTAEEADQAAGSDPSQEPGRSSAKQQEADWRAYFEVANRMAVELESRLKADSGLVLSDYNLLLLLWEEPEHTLTMSQLATGLVFSPSRLNYRVRVLEKAGYVRKSGCPNDRRAFNVTLTPAGRQAFLDAGRIHARHVDTLFYSVLGPEKVALLGDISRTLGEELAR